MVALGERNTRMKDFFDIVYLARNFDFEGAGGSGCGARNLQAATHFPARRRSGRADGCLCNRERRHVERLPASVQAGADHDVRGGDS